MSIISLCILAIVGFGSWIIFKKTYDAFKTEEVKSKTDELTLLNKQHEVVVQSTKKFKNVEQKRKQVNTFKTKGAKK